MVSPIPVSTESRHLDLVRAQNGRSTIGVGVMRGHEIQTGRLDLEDREARMFACGRKIECIFQQRIIAGETPTLPGRGIVFRQG